MCGFISIIGPEGRDVIRDVLDGLLAIQHRGQDAAGVITYDSKFHAKKGLGLVREVFQEKHLARLRGHMAVGHVRYPTVGVGNVTEDVQPFWVDFPLGIAMAHNGNVTNFQELKKTYFAECEINLTSDCDLEAVLYVFANALLGRKDLKAPDIWTAVGEVFRRVKGAYSVVGIIAGKGMFAFRDPYGIKPIIMGERREAEGGLSYAVASESVVLDVAGFTNLRDLKAGEAVWIDKDRNVTYMQVARSPHRPCIFELVYFSRPDSVLDGVSVYKTRLRLGEKMAEAWKKTGLEVDVVIPVPESARTAGQSMAQALGVPCREGLVKNRYIGRTFIMPNDAERRRSIRHKLNPIRLEFEGKRVLILDDSIVRGNTSRQLVKIARDAGAAKVYLASYSPPLVSPCPYGIDMSTKREFIARDHTVDEVRSELGADYLLYQDLSDMVESARVGNPTIEKFCSACFDGHYPTGDVTEEMLSDIENERLSSQV
jgi:amidophosphoribosyltransferase